MMTEFLPEALRRLKRKKAIAMALLSMMDDSDSGSDDEEGRAVQGSVSVAIAGARADGSQHLSSNRRPSVCRGGVTTLQTAS